VVFFERKTHLESWGGEESRKERIMVPVDKVIPFFRGEYTLEMALDALRAKGKGKAELDNFTKLFNEIYTAIDTKQLVPTMRTQYVYRKRGTEREA
jgi:SPX domain protein involved in polyphosphate accumulation